MTLAALNSAIPLPRLGKSAPREVRLFVFGRNETTKGAFTLSKADAEAVVAEFGKQGHALTWDYDHATFTSADPQHRVAAGSCRLAVRDDGLWAVDIEWTDDARRDIEAGKWVFCSPAIVFDGQRRIKAIRNVALTNIPATHNAAPLLLSSRENTMNYLKDMRAGGEAMMAAAQAMTAEGQSDEKVKALGAQTIQALTPLIAMLEELIEAAGEGEGEGELSALRGLRDLTAELLSAKGADVATLRGKLRAFAQRAKGATLSAKDAERTAVKALVQASLSKIPAAERATYEAMPLAELQAFLSDAPVLVPAAPVAQPAQAAVTVAPQSAEADPETLSAVERIMAAAGRK